MEKQIADIKQGDVFHLGSLTLNDDDIISFAKKFDPLEFHIDKIAAEKSIFKALVASGPHVFTVIHKERWIPLFGKSVICGLEVTNWKFLKPVYTNQKINALVSVLSVEENVFKRSVTIRWKYEFTNPQQEMVQHLEMLVLHNLE